MLVLDKSVVLPTDDYDVSSVQHLSRSHTKDVMATSINQSRRKFLVALLDCHISSCDSVNNRSDAVCLHQGPFGQQIRQTLLLFCLSGQQLHANIIGYRIN